MPARVPDLLRDYDENVDIAPAADVRTAARGLLPLLTPAKHASYVDRFEREHHRDTCTLQEVSNCVIAAAAVKLHSLQLCFISMPLGPQCFFL